MYLSVSCGFHNTSIQNRDMNQDMNHDFDDLLFHLQFGQTYQIPSQSRTLLCEFRIFQSEFDELDLLLCAGRHDHDDASHASHESFAALGSTHETRLHRQSDSAGRYSELSPAPYRVFETRSPDATSPPPPPVPFYRSIERAST